MLAHEKGSNDLGFPISPKSDSTHKPKKSQFCAKSAQDSELNELKEKFIPKMKAKEVLCDSFARIGSQEYDIERKEGFFDIVPLKNFMGFSARSVRCRECGTYLVFSHGIYETGEYDTKGRLHSANFCKDRLCPMCNWRRSLKIFGQISKIVDKLESDYKFIFLTLTVPNCSAEDLNQTIDSMNSAFYKMKRIKRFKNAVLGFVRVLEITINNIDGSYHPHFHCILAVKKCYFDSRDYIRQDEWLKMWRDAMEDDSIKILDVRVIKPKKYKGEKNIKTLSSAVAEVAKYAVKSADYLGEYDKKGNLIKPFPNEVIDSRVKTLALALAYRQLVVYGGCFYEMQKKLNLEDAVDGDLLHLEDEELNPYVAEVLIHHSWMPAVGKYEEVKQEIKYCSEVGEAG